MVPTSQRQVKWQVAAIYSVAILGCITILLVPAFFGGYVPLWGLIVSGIMTAAVYAFCIYKFKQNA